MTCPYCNDGEKKCIAYNGVNDCLFRKREADFLKTYKDVDLNAMPVSFKIYDPTDPARSFTIPIPDEPKEFSIEFTEQAIKRFQKHNDDYYMKRVTSHSWRLTKRTFFQRLWRKIKSWAQKKQRGNTGARTN